MKTKRPSARAVVRRAIAKREKQDQRRIRILELMVRVYQEENQALRRALRKHWPVQVRRDYEKVLKQYRKALKARGADKPSTT